jgi:hypothetical protein
MIDIDKAQKEAAKAMLHHRPARRDLGALLAQVLQELAAYRKYFAAEGEKDVL